MLKNVRIIKLLSEATACKHKRCSDRPTHYHRVIAYSCATLEMVMNLYLHSCN